MTYHLLRHSSALSVIKPGASSTCFRRTASPPTLIHRRLFTKKPINSNLSSIVFRNMSTATAPARDTSHQSDIAKMKTEPDGSFKRLDASFRNIIKPDGEFTPEKGRYHLYVSYGCPWATRCLIFRKLKGLEDIIPVTVVSPHMGSLGWPFGDVDEFPGAEPDPLNGAKHIRDLYLGVDPNYAGRFTVPVLWDKKNRTIVNNESSEIIRMFNTGFNHLLPEDKAAVDLYPEALRKEIDSINEWTYPKFNNGVYRTGFATSETAYQSAVKEVFEALDRLEAILVENQKKGEDYLVGGSLTEADVRVYVTAIRFDPVYYGHFKCNIRSIRADYPAIHKWMRKLYWEIPAFKDSTDFDHIKTHYYWSHPSINPTRIVPVGPVPNIHSL